MKKTLSIILSIILIMTFAITSIGLTNIQATQVKLNVSTIKLSIGKTYTLKATITPNNATNKKLIFSSGNKNIATVDKNGKIKGIKAGKTIITVTSSSNKKAVAKCNVIVSADTLITWPLKTPVTFTIMSQYWFYPPDNNMSIYKKLKEMTNINIVWEAIDNAAYNEAITTRLATGINLPDIAQCPLSLTNRLVRDGLILKLDQLIDTQAPELVKYLEQNPVSKGALTFGDGNMYVMPKIIDDNKHMVSNWIINYKLLNSLKLKVPETLDEYNKILNKFKESGIKYPLSSCWGYEKLAAGSFGLHLYPSRGFWAYDGVVRYDYMDQKLKEYYKWLNMLYKAELFDSEFATQTHDNILSKILNNQVGALFEASGNNWHYNEQLKETEHTVFGAMPPVKGPYGDRFQNELYVVQANMGFTISKSCKNPDVAVRLLSWTLLDGVAKDLSFFGVEGIEYNIVNGKKVRVEGWTNDFHMRNGGAWNLPFNCMYPKHAETWPNQNAAQNEVTSYSLEAAKFFIPPYPNNSLLDTENEKYTKIMTDIQTYVEEMRIKFIKGNESFDKFDDYVKILINMGIKDALKIEQARYDRFLKFVGK